METNIKTVRESYKKLGLRLRGGFYSRVNKKTREQLNVVLEKYIYLFADAILDKVGPCDFNDNGNMDRLYYNKWGDICIKHENKLFTIEKHIDWLFKDPVDNDEMDKATRISIMIAIMEQAAEVEALPSKIMLALWYNLIDEFREIDPSF